MVARVPAQVSKFPPRLHAANTHTKQLPPSSPLSAPRNARIPSVLSSLRILPVVTGVYHQSIPDDRPSGLQTCQPFCLHRLGASLPSLSAFFCTRFLCFQSFAASFPKTPGVGVPARELVRCTEAQKCLSVPPLPAALTHSVSRKSFPCDSYENIRDGSATVAPASASVSLCLVGNPNSARPLARHSPLPTGAAVPPILHFWGFPTFMRSVILSQRGRIQYIQ